MRALVTGAGGFLGGALVRQLLARGDDVAAVVRHIAGATDLATAGCELVQLDLAADDPSALVQALRGRDALFHLAGSYRIGIPGSQRAQMYEANVAATRNILDAADAAGIERIIYTSTGNVLGDTAGHAPDESYRRPQPARFLSYYDETKYLAHRLVEERVAAGAPVLVAMPGMVYGPGDHSQAGAQILRAMAGRLGIVAGADLGGNLVHVDDVAAGHLLIHDAGQVGRAYLLGGERARMGEVLKRAAALGGHQLPRLGVPSWLLRGIAPLGDAAAALSDRIANFGELVRAGTGVTYWFSDARARSELGYAPRDLDAGLRTLLPA
ncbi:MAG TPA: NAD-dependent epimerase/dehydratase family protein [Candidatus Limnocylindria bacterium]|jgi:dihydroflavonol-4-reductase|nr:NAD-dependent epimerase/dehydratase family protein [Candidatus Limnocylindria bacterium]